MSTIQLSPEKGSLGFSYQTSGTRYPFADYVDIEGRSRQAVEASSILKENGPWIFDFLIFEL